MIPNPDYIGVWAPRQIPNPAFFVDNEPHKMNAIGAVGVEIWTMQKNIEFDNFYFGHSVAEAKEFATQTYGVKKLSEKTAEDLQAEADRGVMDDVMDFVTENSVAVAVTVVAGFVLIIILINMGGTSEAPAAPAATTPPGTGVSLASPKKQRKEEEEEEEEADADDVTADADADDATADADADAADANADEQDDAE